MDEPKDLVPAGEGANIEPATTAGPKPATAQPDLKTAGKIASAPDSGNGLTTEAGDASVNTGLGRPLPPRPAARPRPVARRRRNPLGWIFIVLLAAAAGAGAFFYVRSTQTNPAFQGQTTSATTRLPVSVAISANGQVQANADLGVTFSTGGTLTKLNKKLGDQVKVGDTLAQIDDADLQTAIKSAQASYDQQLASYKKATDGATQKDLDQAQAQVDQAKANLNKTVTGTFTTADISSAQASINSAAAKLNELRQGGKPYEIASAQSGISSAESQLTSAKAKLAKTLAGADNATIVSAQATYDQAVANYDKSISSLKLAITNAQVARDQQLNALKGAQDKYQTAYSNNRNADGTLKSNLPQSAIDAETNAYRGLQDAQGNYNKAEAALNDAKVSLDTQSRTLQSQIDNAKAQLDKAKQGPTQADIAADQASVASAQSSLDNAKKALLALTPSTADVAAAEASLASAQASLAKLKGGTPDDIAASEASLKIQQATLEDLKRGPKPNDIAIAKAQLDVAQISLDKSKLTAANAVLKSPINGTIVQAPLAEGQAITAATVVYQVVDLSSLHVDVTVGETDIAKIKEGTAVAVNLDGISSRSFTGKITFISSKSTVTQNVVNYLATVTLDQGTANSLFEAYQGEFNKLLQRPTGGTGRGAAPGGAAGAAPGGFQIPAGANLPRGASAQIAAATGICGYSLAGLFGQAQDQAQPKPGMTANVTVCLNLKAGILSVPNRAIKTKSENGQRISYVDVLVDKATSKIESRPISVGLAGDNYTEVTGGDLKDGDLIVLSTTPTNRGAGGGATPFG